MHLPQCPSTWKQPIARTRTLFKHMLPTKADKPQGEKTLEEEARKRPKHADVSALCPHLFNCCCIKLTGFRIRARHLSSDVFKMQINSPWTQTGSALFMSHGHKGAENNGDRKGTGCFCWCGTFSFRLCHRSFRAFTRTVHRLSLECSDG